MSTHQDPRPADLVESGIDDELDAVRADLAWKRARLAELGPLADEPGGRDALKRAGELVDELLELEDQVAERVLAARPELADALETIERAAGARRAFVVTDDNVDDLEEREREAEADAELTNAEAWRDAVDALSAAQNRIHDLEAELADTAEHIGGGDDAATLLIAHGYTALRERIIGAITAAATIDVASYEAALAYARQSAARLKLDTDPRATGALAGIDRELPLLEAALKYRKALKDLAERQSARDKLAGR